jgi:mycoredoxin
LGIFLTAFFRRRATDLMASITRQDTQAELKHNDGDRIVMYSTSWCGDCRRAKRVFEARGLAYTEISITEDMAAAAVVMRLNGGMRSVPTILFPDGSILVEPSAAALEAKLASLGE